MKIDTKGLSFKEILKLYTKLLFAKVLISLGFIAVLLIIAVISYFIQA